MNKRHLIIATFIFASASFVRADDHIHYTYDLEDLAAKTLQALGTDFMVCCVTLAIALVVTAVIFKGYSGDFMATKAEHLVET